MLVKNYASPWYYGERGNMGCTVYTVESECHGECMLVRENFLMAAVIDFEIGDSSRGTIRRIC